MRIEKLWKNLCQTVRTGARRFRTAVAADVVLLLCLGAFTYREIYEAEAWYLEEAGCAAAAAAVGCIFAVSLHLFFERRGKEHRRVEAILTAAVCAAVFILVRGTAGRCRTSCSKPSALRSPLRLLDFIVWRAKRRGAPLRLSYFLCARLPLSAHS